MPRPCQQLQLHGVCHIILRKLQSGVDSPLNEGGNKGEVSDLML